MKNLTGIETLETMLDWAEEVLKWEIFEIEVSIGLAWFPSIRDDFRYLWS